MKIYEVKVYQEFDVPADQVWEAFNDHATFGKIMGQKVQRVLDSKDPANINGIGSVRSLSMPLMAFEESILKSEKPQLIEYKISRGMPLLQHHYGKIEFAGLPGGRSSVNYTIELGSKYPFLGAVVKKALGKGIADGLSNYARRLKK